MGKRRAERREVGGERRKERGRVERGDQQSVRCEERGEMKESSTSGRLTGWFR